VFTKLGQARSRVSYFAGAFPNYPPPDIVEFTATAGKVLDESGRVEKALKARDAREERRLARTRNWRVREAEREYERAKERLERVR
jgi:hypothetical protein